MLKLVKPKLNTAINLKYPWLSPPLKLNSLSGFYIMKEKGRAGRETLPADPTVPFIL
jgi:hypothetical protein